MIGSLEIVLEVQSNESQQELSIYIFVVIHGAGVAHYHISFTSDRKVTELVFSTSECKRDLVSDLTPLNTQSIRNTTEDEIIVIRVAALLHVHERKRKH